MLQASLETLKVMSFQILLWSVECNTPKVKFKSDDDVALVAPPSSLLGFGSHLGSVLKYGLS